MNNFIHFIKKPKYSESCKKINWKMFFLLFFASVIIIPPMIFVIKMAVDIWGFSYKKPQMSCLKLLFFAAIYAPIVEELLFRSLLVFKKSNIISYLSICFLLGIWFFYNGSYQSILNLTAVVVAVALALVFYNQSKEFVVKRYPIVFYFSSIVFGLVHIFNYQGVTFHNFIFSILLVLPQLTLGVVLGYIRVTYGLAYSILFHFLCNLPGAIVVYCISC